MKRFNPNTKTNSILWRFAVCTMIAFLYSCGSGGSGDGSSQTGSVRFSLTLSQEQGAGRVSNIRASADATSPFECDTYAISTIEARVVDENNALLTQGGPWNCEQHQATINNVASGDRRIVRISANNEFGATIFWGQSEPLKIEAGRQTDAGNIYLEPVNNAPDLNQIGNQVINEGELLEFNVSATDPDGDVLIFEIGNKPPDAEFTYKDLGNGEAIGKFSWTPAFDSAENYRLIFKVTDNGVPALSAFEEITISVGNEPQPPVLSQIGNKTVREGELLEFDVYATDPDSIHLRFEIGNKPTDADFTFEDFGDGTGTATFSWIPDFDSSGNYPVIFKVFDDTIAQEGGALSDFEEITIEVGNVCRAPELDPIVPPPGKEGELLQFTVTAKDADLPDDTLSFDCISEDIACDEYFDPSTQLFSWIPGFESADNYQVRFIVNDDCPDGPQEDFEDVTITVGNTCRPPVLDPIGSQSVNENEMLSFTISATDPDLPNDELSFSCVSNDGLCEYFDPSTKAFSWTPGYDDAGTYTVRIIVTDACEDPEPQQDIEDVTIFVEDINREPTLTPIGNKDATCSFVTIDGNLKFGLSFTVSGSDPDGDNLIFSLESLPKDNITEIFTDNGDGTATYTAYGSGSKNYQLNFIVTDDSEAKNGPLSDSELIEITEDLSVPCGVEEPM